MMSNDEVMLYREEVRQLIRDLRYIRGRLHVVLGSPRSKRLPAEDSMVFGALDKWIDRLKMMLKWRRVNC